MLRLLGANHISAAAATAAAIEAERFLQSRERHAQKVATIANRMIHQQVVMAEMRIRETGIDHRVHVEGAGARHEISSIRMEATATISMWMVVVMVSVEIGHHVQVIHVHEQAGRIETDHPGGGAGVIAGGRWRRRHGGGGGGGGGDYGGLGESLVFPAASPDRHVPEGTPLRPVAAAVLAEMAGLR